MSRAALLLLLAGVASVPAPAADACRGEPNCMATRSFVAKVTSVRTSTQGNQHLVSATVQFENTSGKPLALGYVRDSGVAIDGGGNRYAIVAPGGVRAIGEVSGSTFDAKFTLQAGEAADARFEFASAAGAAKPGAQPAFDIELAVREIVPASGAPQRLGAEYALQFAPSSGSASAASAPTTAPPAPVAAAVPAAPVDPCGGSPRCFSAGTFVAEIMQVTASAMPAGARNQSLAFNVRFRNVSSQPVILAYRSTTSSATDNFGNPFYWGRAGTHDTSVKGIGIITGRGVDTQFSLAPGQSRNATFGLTRYNAAPPIGNAWTWDVVIDEVEILPGQVVRSARQNSLNFTNLSAGSFAGVTPAGVAGTSAADAAGATAPTDVTDVASKVIDLFNKIKKE